MTKEFILNTLVPYKQDKTLCANVDNACYYLTDDNRKCAVGKHLIDGEHQTLMGDVYALNDKYGLNNILTIEAKEQEIPIDVWKQIQLYHDSIFNDMSKYYNLNKIEGVITSLEELTGFRFDELRVK